jgi:hypothetical protein
VISPSQGRYLHTGQHKHKINVDTNIGFLSGIRTHDPAFKREKVVNALDRAATVIGTRSMFNIFSLVLESKIRVNTRPNDSKEKRYSKNLTWFILVRHTAVGILHSLLFTLFNVETFQRKIFFTMKIQHDVRAK